MDRDHLKDGWAAVKGTVAMKVGLVAPVLLLVLVGVVELGDGIFEGMQVQDAAEAGGLYVANNGAWNTAGIRAAVANATQTRGITARPAPSQFCGCPTDDGITAIACATTCAGGIAAGTYVRIEATLPHNPLLTLPGLALPTNLTRSAIVRLN